jgi:hypothetical protein
MDEKDRQALDPPSGDEASTTDHREGKLVRIVPIAHAIIGSPPLALGRVLEPMSRWGLALKRPCPLGAISRHDLADFLRVATACRRC